ncbi:universal stress protein [Candidatus Nitrosotenuis chungbukensis]|uniref:universal stress protein n=1 Tax=Candidatus Nitrosotenuis chungbukensis TaxID=1353246 RepID=UPI0005B26FBA|nr:universal stress protein [Candidatus Nitrosotenuis chungbukensis]WKT58683.1 universal stress protein [Candidatus Nitrosotenuis chungbukensis]
MSRSGIKRILVPLDGSKNSIRGLDNAIYLARQCQATITGIYILPRVPVRAYRAIQYPEKELLKDADRNMEYAKKHCAQNGIVFEKKISFGDPGYTIVKYAKDRKFDIIVIGARGRGSIKEVFFGSVSNYVVHKAGMPVLIVK